MVITLVNATVKNPNYGGLCTHTHTHTHVRTHATVYFYN